MRRALRPRAALLLALCLALAAAFPGPAAAQSQPVITIAAGTSPVTEGTAASFTVTASPAPNANLVVNLTVADVPYHRGFLASTTTGAKMVTIPANATSAPYSVPTVNRTRDTASGPVTVTVATGSDYTVGTASSASVRVEDTNPTGATWTISDNSAVEGGTSGNDLGSIEFFLFRNLYPGEALAIPLAFSGAVRGTDFTLALQDDTDGDPPDGVVLSGATLTVTGSDAGSATSGIRVALAALPDADAETETVTVSAGPAAPTGLDGGVSFSQDGTNDEIRLSERTNLLTIERHADVAARVTEGASTTFRIRRAVGGGSYSNGALSVSVSVADAPGADFVASGSQGARTVAMAASDQWKDFSVSTDDDNTDEPSGPVTATLQAVANDFGYAVGDPGAASVYVRDNDGPAEPEVTIAAGSAVTEGASASFTVTANPAPAANLTVNLTVADAPHADFVDAANEGTGKTVTIPTTGSVTYNVATRGDGTDEPSGPVKVTVTSGSGYEVGTASSASVAVADNDVTRVVLRTPDATATEGVAADTATITVTLNRGLVSGETLVAPLTFAGGTRNTDFTLALSGSPAGVSLSGATVTFTGPSTGVTATVATVLLTASDESGQAHETLTVGLGTLTATSLGGGATSSLAASAIVILDDDVNHVLSVRVSANADEGDAGVAYREVFFDVTPARPREFPFKVCFSGTAQRYRTVADQQAGLKIDYAVHDHPPERSGSGVAVGRPETGYPEGCTTGLNAFTSDKRYYLGVIGDTDIEPDEAAVVTVLRHADTPATVTISSTAGSASYGIANDDNNDPEITIAAGTSPVTEGTAASFTVTASPAPTANLPVNLTVADAPHSDFVIAANEGAGKTVTVPTAGTVTYNVATDGDDADESNGPVTVTVTDGTGYTVGSPASAPVTVEDDDATEVTLSGAAGNLTEGGAKDIVLTLGRGLRQGETLTAPLTFAGTASRNADFTLACPSPLPAGVTCANLNSGAAQVVFTGPASGTTARSVTIALTATADSTAETTAETVEIGLGTLASTGLGGGASSTDSLADFSIADPALPEANFAAASSNAAEDAGTHNVGVTLSPAPTTNLTLGYTVGGSATSGSDYTALAGSVSVASGATSVNVPVAITDDSDDESDETVELTLTAGAGYTVGSTSVHTLTIQDNDSPPAAAGVTVSTSRSSIVLDEGDPAEAYTVVLNKAPAANVTVTGTVVRGATALGIHKAPGTPGASVTLTFTPSNWSQPQTVLMTPLEDSNTADDVARIDHMVTGTGEYRNVTARSLVVAVDDNDSNPKPVVTIQAGATLVTEGAAATFTVRSNPAPSGDMPVNLEVEDAPNSDFVAAANEGAGQTVTIPANVATATYRLALTADDVDEPNGPVTVTVTIAGSLEYDAGTPGSASVTVRDADPTPVVLGAVDDDLQEGSADDTGEIIVVLPRELVAGEVLAVPLVFSGGALNTDFTLAFKAAYAGVSFDWTTTAWSTLTFTGPSVAEANLVMTALADGDTADDLMRVSIPTSSSTGNPRLTATNLGGGARGVSRTSWGLTVRDDDAGGTPGLIESAGRLNLVEGGPPGGYKVRLRTQPAGAVTVTASSESPQTFRVHAAGGTPGASATLTFSPTDWNRPREVTVTTREDADAADAMLTIAHAVTGTGDYAAISPDPITVFVVDDEGETRLPSAPPTGGGGPGGGGGGPAPPPPGPPPPPPPPPPGPPPSTGPPDASFTVAGADCEGDLCVTFTGVPTTLSDTSAGAVVARAWDTGDGRRSPSAVLRYVWTEPGYYRVTLRVSGSGTDSEAHRTFLVRPAEPAGRCVPSDEIRCLRDERYRLRVDWWTADGQAGPARVVREGTDDSALFQFFDPNNWEILVKVLDGCRVNGQVWTFGASATDLGYEIVVVDTTGADPPAVYRNAPGARAAAFTDTGAFAGGCTP